MDHFVYFATIQSRDEFWIVMEQVQGCTAEDIRVVKGFAENHMAFISKFIGKEKVNSFFV